MPSRWGAAWAFVAVALAACTSGSGSDDPSPAAAASSQVTPTEQVEIDGIVIDEPDWKASGANWRLRVSWEEPDDVAVDHYELRRDGVTVDREIEATTFLDDDVEPGARYRYQVVGVDLDGVETHAATASITTDRPRLSEARLQGTFTVRMVVERASGTNDPVRGGAIYFTFDPRCRSGACDVRWTVRGARTRGTLLRADAVYDRDAANAVVRAQLLRRCDRRDGRRATPGQRGGPVARSMASDDVRGRDRRGLVVRWVHDRDDRLGRPGIAAGLSPPWNPPPRTLRIPTA